MTLDYTGEQVNSAVAAAKDMVCGTTEVTVGSNCVFIEQLIDIGFDATENTKVIAVLRDSGTSPMPVLNICLMTRRRGSYFYVQLTHGAVNGSTMPYMHSGKYYIDWLVISK